MRIAQITDTHLLDLQTADRKQAARRVADFEKTINAINALPEQPDVVIHSGDVAHDAKPREYGLSREILSQLRAPVFATLGNRDRRPAFREVFARDGYLPKPENPDGFAQYAIDIAGVRLVAVDTLQLGSRRGEICRERHAAAEQMITAAAQKPVIVFMHHPPVRVPGLDWPMFDDEPAAARFLEMLKRHRQVAHILSGHTHRADVIETGGPPVSVMSAVATQLRIDDYPESRQAVPVFHIHDVEAFEPCLDRADVITTVYSAD